MVAEGRFRNARAAIIFIAMMLCLYGWHAMARSFATLQLESKGALVANPRPVPPLVSKLSKQIAAAPLNQDLVNSYYVAAAQGQIEMSAEQINKLRSALFDLGWRSTAAQQNILIHAIENSDIKTIALRADAMLRRKQLTAEVTELLFLFETDPQSRTELISRLKLRPEWREAVLTNRAGISTPARLNARTQTLYLMFQTGLRPTQLEVAPVSGLLLDDGKGEEAYDLWMKYNGLQSTDALYDSSFDYAAKAHEAEYYIEFPFEWRPRRGPGYSSSFVQDGDDAQAILRWNGRGAPELMDQYFRGLDGNQNIHLAGPELDSIAIKALDFIVDCDGRRVYFDAAVAQKQREVTLSTDAAISCDYPRLLILGKPGNGKRPIEVRLSSIEIKPRL